MKFVLKIPLLGLIVRFITLFTSAWQKAKDEQMQSDFIKQTTARSDYLDKVNEKYWLNFGKEYENDSKEK